MNLFKITTALCLVGALAGCAEYQLAKNAIEYAADATVPPTVGLVAANAFDGFEATATDALGGCTPNSAYPQIPRTICVAQASNLKTMGAAVTAGRVLRNAIEPTGAGAVPVSGAVYNKLETEIAVLQAAIAAFNTAKGA